MRFSVWPTTKQPWDDLLGIATHAERTGWDGVWVSDHFMGSTAPLIETPTLEAWSVIAALATAVPRVRLGTLVLGNGYRHPSVVAKMAATLDQISGGRLILGLGAGWQENEHAAYGIRFHSPRERLARLEEACVIIKSLLTNERSTFVGKFYELSDAPCAPKPVQHRLPLLIGGSGEKVTIPLAARWADEWNYWGSPESFAHKTSLLNQHCESIGRDPATVRRSVQALVEPDVTGIRTVECTGAKATISGSAEQLRDQLGQFSSAGANEFIVPDWNAGTGAAREDFFDWFSLEVADGLRT